MKLSNHKAGIIVGAICFLHCMITPFIPIVFLKSEETHVLAIIFSVFVAGTIDVHQLNPISKVLRWIAVFLLVVGGLFHTNYLVISGSVILTALHWFLLRGACNQCDHKY